MSLQTIINTITAGLRRPSTSRRWLRAEDFDNSPASAFGDYLKSTLPFKTLSREGGHWLEVTQAGGIGGTSPFPPPEGLVETEESNGFLKFFKVAEDESNTIKAFRLEGLIGHIFGEAQKNVAFTFTEDDTQTLALEIRVNYTDRSDFITMSILNWLEMRPLDRVLFLKENGGILERQTEDWHGFLKVAHDGESINSEGVAVEIGGDQALRTERLVLPISLNRGQSDTWTLGLSEAVSQNLTVSELAAFLNVGVDDLAAFLPPNLQSAVFDATSPLTLSGFIVDLNFETPSATGFTMGLAQNNADAAWTLFNDFGLKDIRFLFQLLTPDPASRTLNLALTGNIQVQEGSSLPNFMVVGQLGGSSIWKAGLSAGDASTLKSSLESLGEVDGAIDLGGFLELVESSTPESPLHPFQSLLTANEEGQSTISSIGDIIRLAGNEVLSNSIPPAILALTDVHLQSLVFDFDPTSPTLHHVHFALAKPNAFELVEALPAIADLALSMDFANLHEENSTLACELTGALPFVDFDDPEREVNRLNLALNKDEESWRITGQLADTIVPVSAADALTTFLGQGNFFWPGDDLGIGKDRPTLPPDLHFTIFLKEPVGAERSAGDFELGLTSDDKIELVPGQIEIKNIGLALSRIQGLSSQEGRSIDATLSGSIAVANDFDVNLKAVIPAGEAAGFEISGSLNTPDDTGIDIADLVDNIGKERIESLEGMAIKEIHATYAISGSATNKEKRLLFEFAGTIPIVADPQVDFSPTIHFEYNIAGAEKELVINGVLPLPSLENERIRFDFTVIPTSSFLSAQVIAGADEQFRLDELIGLAIPHLGSELPEIPMPIQSLFMIYEKKDDLPDGAKGTFILGAGLTTSMDFSQIPLAGSFMSENDSIGVEDVTAFYTTQALSAETVVTLNADYGLNLPSGAINKGAGISASVGLGNQGSLPFSVTVEKEESASEPTPRPVDGTPTRRKAPLPAPGPDDPGKWFDIDKNLGPLYIARIGLYFLEGNLMFVLDAALSVGPMTVALEDLSFGSPLDEFKPAFNLRGLGLSYSNPPVEIAGLFLRINNQSGGGDRNLIIKDRFAGAAIIKTAPLTLAAIGEYATVNGDPSFYLYAFLGVPIGGPAFFFVEGLAAGFGYNRSIRLPEDMDQLPKHPMVAVATQDNIDLLELADSLVEGNFIPIDPGRMFFAVGVRFTTFKILDSFALLAATFGKPFRIDLIGLSKLILPTPIKGKAAPTPLAEITLAFQGTFIPEEGFLGVRAQLTSDSYILSRDCTLQGGFAFYTWFEGSQHSGDFVLTLGGYHPLFQKPAHYPSVPRLGFNWILSEEIQIIGRMYFALTPTAVMAGGSLEATFESGPLKAWFTIGADFLIAWKPYHYDARVYLNFGISYTFWAFGEQTISIDISAELHIWGPEFNGIATIDIGIAKVEIPLGEEEETPQELPPITWNEFHKSFLPETSGNITIASGLQKNAADGSWIVSSRSLRIITDSIIPLESIDVNDSAITISGKSEFGISTMDKQKDEVTTNLVLKVYNGSDNSASLVEDVGNLFKVTGVTKALPKAIWGNEFKLGQNGEKLIKELLTGVEIDLLPPGDPDNMSWVEKEPLFTNVDTAKESPQIGWKEELAFVAGAGAAASNFDEQLLEAFGMDAATKELLTVQAPAEVIIESNLAELDLAISEDEGISIGSY